MKMLPLAQRLFTASIIAALPISLQAQTSDTWKPSVLGGDWSNSANWQNGAIPNGVGDSAWFTPANGTAGPYTVNLETEVALQRLILSGYSGSSANKGWTLTGEGGLNFGAGGIIDLRAGSGILLTLETAVKADYGLTIKGDNTATASQAVINWKAPSSSISGGLVLENASVSTLATGNLFGGADITFSGTGTNRLNLARDGNSGAGNISNNIKLAGAATSGLVFSYFHASQSWDINVSGTISEQGGPRNIQYFSGSSGAGGGRFIVSGDNTYTGNTVIGGGSTGPIVVRATHSNALGKGTAAITFDTLSGNKNSLELAGGIKIENKTITLNGDGFNSAGGLNSVSGDNEWAGTVATTALAEHRIGVEAGSLKISGVIHGNRITKVGSGLLELASNNAFTKGFRAWGGTLLVSADGALGEGNVEISNAILAISKGTYAQVDGDFTLTSTAKLKFDISEASADSASSLLSVSGNQFGNGDILVELAGADAAALGRYHLLTVAGTTTGITFTLAPEALGLLEWENGVLTYISIPEPAAVLLTLLPLAGLGLRCACRRAA